MYSIISEPDKILSQFTIGNDISSLKIKEDEIIIQFENKRGINTPDMNIILEGYSRPKKFIRNTNKLIIIDKGEYAVYLYFNSENELIDKEIVGT